MPKQMSCSKVIGRAIRKFGLPAVQAAIEMAVELGQTQPEPLAQRPKPRTKAAAVSATPASTQPE